MFSKFRRKQGCIALDTGETYFGPLEPIAEFLWRGVEGRVGANREQSPPLVVYFVIQFENVPSIKLLCEFLCLYDPICVWSSRVLVREKILDSGSRWGIRA